MRLWEGANIFQQYDLLFFLWKEDGGKEKWRRPQEFSESLHQMILQWSCTLLVIFRLKAHQTSFHPHVRFSCLSLSPAPAKFSLLDFPRPTLLAGPEPEESLIYGKDHARVQCHQVEAGCAHCSIMETNNVETTNWSGSLKINLMDKNSWELYWLKKLGKIKQ